MGIYKGSEQIATPGVNTRLTATSTSQLVDSTDKRFVTDAQKSSIEDLTINGAGETYVFNGRRMTIVNPYSKPKANWYKGQIHCHTTNSDGSDSPTALMTAYKNAGFDFVSITDHNYLTPDPGVSGILFIPGIEATLYAGHITITGANSMYTGLDANHVIGNVGTVDIQPQPIIDFYRKLGAYVSMAHPTYAPKPWTDAELAGIRNYNAIEISNGLNSKNEAISVDNFFGTYGKANLNAVDDCHSISSAAFNNGWVMVNADELTQEAILQSLKEGNYYASRGVDLQINQSGRTITATTQLPAAIKWYSCKNDNVGVVLKTDTNATSSTYDIKGDEGYVRVEITRDSDSMTAFSNPIYVELLERPRKITSTSEEGVWVTSNLIVADLTSFPTTDLVLDLSGYLPNDGYVYEVLVMARGQTTKVVGERFAIYIRSDIFAASTVLGQARCDSTAQNMECSSSLVYPVGSARTITLAGGATYKCSSLYIEFKGYKRLGYQA
jgi:hypothetical protein